MINLNDNLNITAIINLTLELHLLGCHRVEKKPSYQIQRSILCLYKSRPGCNLRGREIFCRGKLSSEEKSQVSKPLVVWEQGVMWVIHVG